MTGIYKKTIFSDKTLVLFSRNTNIDKYDQISVLHCHIFVYGLKLGDIFPLASVVLYFHYLLFSYCRIHHFDDKFVHYHYMITLQNIHSRWMHSTIRDILLKMITNCNHNTGPPVDYYMTSFEGSIWAIRRRKSKKDNTIECSVD